MAPVGVDYLVYTPEEFDCMVVEGNHFIVQEILPNGKVLYERPPSAAITASKSTHSSGAMHV